MRFRFKSSDEVTGFLDKGANVTGELEFTGVLRIDGNFHGSISTGDTLIIGEHATIHADIRAGEVEVHGHVFGSIEAKRRIEISATGRVRGDLQSPVVVMTTGALLDGRVRMAGDRLEETTIAARQSTTEEKTRQDRH